MSWHRLCAIFGLAILCALLARGADEPDKKGEEFFDKRIRPIFTDKCQKCHGPDRTEGNLRVDSYEGISEGGVSGEFVVPGKPDDSLLIEAVSYKNEDLQMPPDAKLSAQEIEDLRQWVKQGAPHPDAPKDKKRS
jgi:mono/diheme cytochrome c family protein